MTPLRQYLQELRQLARLAPTDTGDPLETSLSHNHQEVATPSSESLRLSMNEDLEAFVRAAAEIYEELSIDTRRLILPKLQVLQDQMDQAYRETDWATFQAALVEARTLLSQARVEEDSQELASKHWIYRVWSRVLDAEVWFVCCEREVAALLKKGVQRGSIYTKTELSELVHLPKSSPQDLKKFHLVKSYFNATIVKQRVNR